MWDFVCFGKDVSLVNDRFMWMVHEIFHFMFESKEISFCWGIHIYTDTNCKILNIIASFNSDVYETTNPVIEGSYMLFLNFYSSSPMRVLSKKSVFSNDVSTGKGDC